MKETTNLVTESEIRNFSEEIFIFLEQNLFDPIDFITKWVNFFF